MNSDKEYVSAVEYLFENLEGLVGLILVQYLDRIPSMYDHIGTYFCIHKRDVYLPAYTTEVYGGTGPLLLYHLRWNGKTHGCTYPPRGYLTFCVFEIKHN